MKVGDIVTYADINLRDYKGTVVAVGPTKHGGNLTVRWTRYSFDSEEHTCNVIRRTETNQTHGTQS